METRLLMISRSFYPATGGQESVALVLARGFARHGIATQVITNTKLGTAAELREDFAVLRTPTVRMILKSVKWSTICFHHSLSLRSCWPLLILRRRWIVLHHILYADRSLVLSFLKKSITGLAENIYPSEYIRNVTGKKGRIIFHPLDDVFCRRSTISKTKDLLFAGRLVSDKGCSVLIHALWILKHHFNLRPCLTIAGDGPMKTRIKKAVRAWGLDRQVEFTNELQPEQLAGEMNRHRLIIVPSVSPEPFGLVTVEAIACGCLPIVSDTGGLPESTLGRGWLFTAGDPKALAERIAVVYPVVLSLAKEPALPGSLSRHRQQFVMERYLTLFNDPLS